MTLTPNPEIERDADYALMETDDGEVVIYDRDEPEAWLLSDTIVDVTK